VPGIEASQAIMNRGWYTNRRVYHNSSGRETIA
jgi:hypothetical protein